MGVYCSIVLKQINNDLDERRKEMISQELSQFTNSLCVVAVILFLIAVGAIVYFFTRSFEKKDMLCLPLSFLSGLSILFGLFALLTAFTGYDSEIILTQKLFPFTFLDQKGNLIYEDKIPDKVPTIYELGISSGYTVRNSNWVYRVGVKDVYAWEIANYDFILWIEGNKALLAGKGVVSFSKDIETVTKNMSPDFGWIRDFPGKVQGVAKFLVWPEGDIERARIEKCVFQ